MKYRIDGDMFPSLDVILDEGEQIYTNSGAMAWMERGIDMNTNMKDGFFSGLGRMFSGNSLFVVTYTGMRNNAKMSFTTRFMGQIMPHRFDGGNGLIVQKAAFLCAQPNVNMETVFTKKFSSGFFGGEGFILQRLSGNGMAFIEGSGRIVKRELATGEELLVDTGNLVAFEDSVSYEIETVKGFKNVFFGGEGLFLVRMRGPGVVYLQTQTPRDVAQCLIPYLPTRSSND